MPTGHGCAALPRRGSALVRALRDAGAVNLGKTVTTGMGGTFPSPSTNPIDRERTPGRLVEAIGCRHRRVHGAGGDRHAGRRVADQTGKLLRQ
jgi:hypothetical protein